MNDDALNYDNFFRNSHVHQDRLRFWTSGMGRLPYIPQEETGAGDPHEGDSWSDISALQLSSVAEPYASISPSTTSSFISEFYKNSAFHHQHDTSTVSANLSVAKNTRHLPLVLSYGDGEQKRSFSNVRDCIRAVETMIESDRDICGQVYNLSLIHI